MNLGGHLQFIWNTKNGCLTSSWEYVPLWYVVHVRFWVEITYQLGDNMRFLYWWTRHFNIQITAWPKLDRTQTKPPKIGNEAMIYTGNSFTVVKMFSIYLHDPHLGPECFHLGQRSHYTDVTKSTMESQITGVSIVCSTVCSGVDQRKLAFVSGITGDSQRANNAEFFFPFDEVIMGIQWPDFERDMYDLGKNMMDFGGPRNFSKIYSIVYNMVMPWISSYSSLGWGV